MEGMLFTLYTKELLYRSLYCFLCLLFTLSTTSCYATPLLYLITQPLHQLNVLLVFTTSTHTFLSPFYLLLLHINIFFFFLYFIVQFVFFLWSSFTEKEKGHFYRFLFFVCCSFIISVYCCFFLYSSSYFTLQIDLSVFADKPFLPINLYISQLFLVFYGLSVIWMFLFYSFPFSSTCLLVGIFLFLR